MLCGCDRLFRAIKACHVYTADLPDFLQTDTRITALKPCGAALTMSRVRCSCLSWVGQLRPTRRVPRHEQTFCPVLLRNVCLFADATQLEQ